MTSTEKKYAIHTVFIAKENILFLEQWIDYHILLGFDKFYLYDNSKVQLPGSTITDKKNIITGKVNKYKVKYGEIVKLSDKEIQHNLEYIKNKYKGIVKIFEWSPRDAKGKILYNQVEAHNHCLKKLKNDKIHWAAYIDMDEYIVINNNLSIKDYMSKLPKNINNVRLGQIRFDSRFNNMDKLVLEINKRELTDLDRDDSNKNIFKVSETNNLTVHHWKGKGKEIVPPLKDIFFAHFKLNNKEYINSDLFSPIIKQKMLKNKHIYLGKN